MVQSSTVRTLVRPPLATPLITPAHSQDGAIKGSTVAVVISVLPTINAPQGFPPLTKLMLLKGEGGLERWLCRVHLKEPASNK